VPELPSTHVARHGLTAHLSDSVADFAVTFVAGFAGSGKTVGLAEWARTEAQVAWLSCDITDADPVQFWTALIAALGSLGPNIGSDALDLLDSDGRLGHDAIASIVNDLVTRKGEQVIVIDDLHFVARSAMESLAALIDRLPSHTRVVLSARSDPRLPLHRWRAAGRLGEVRAPQLRLTTTEVAQLVHNVGVEISADDAAVLTDRTEGWAAGVQLAALSMRNEPDPSEFIRNFAGTDRNVADFLVGEVLRRRPDDTVTFLLETSVLDELSGPLCDALTGRSDSSTLLADLETENLFVIPLDSEQTLYRYHHLFAELLRKLLAARHPERTDELHRAASDWYAQHDDPRRAVRHAVLSRDPALVTALLRGGVISGFFTGTGEMVRDWINDLSRAHIDMSPELMIEYAIALGLATAFEDARTWLARASAALPPDAPPMLRARLATARAFTTGSLGEVESAMEAATEARSLSAPGADSFIDTALQHVLVRCYLYVDDLPAARAMVEQGRPAPDAPGQLQRVILGGVFSQVELEAGDLESARDMAESSVAAMTALDADGHIGANEAFRSLGMLAYEQDRLDDAEQLFDRCVTLVWNGRPIFLLLTRLELARVWNARGDIESAFIELDSARAALTANLKSPLVDRVTGYRARLLCEHGNIAAARRLVAELPIGRRRSIAEIRLQLAEQDERAAAATLDTLAESNRTRREELEFAALDARRALQADSPDLDAKLEIVLNHGRSGGFIRTLADEGPALATALAAAVRRRPTDPYSDTLAPVLERTIAVAPATNVPLFGGVMLSERELTVLKYLATRLSTREIADELYVSMNTFRTHTKSIYRKLGVDSRAGAVEAARGLGIL
jgi:LuxR family maltose regulon positive regulatory protein